MHVTAIVVARGGSKRVPNKALRSFGASTLLGHKIDQLRKVEEIHSVIVGSDSNAILQEAVKHGADTRYRDEYHCDETRCSAQHMIQNMVAMVETDVVVWAHPTNPLCDHNQYSKAINKYAKVTQGGEYDSLCSVSRVQRHCWQHGKPVNFHPWGDRHPFASELTPMHFQNGAIFIRPHVDMLRKPYFYGEKPFLFDIQAPYDIDIDTETDLMVAQAVYERTHDLTVYAAENGARGKVLLDGIEVDSAAACCPDGGWVDCHDFSNGFTVRRQYGDVQFVAEVT